MDLTTYVADFYKDQERSWPSLPIQKQLSTLFLGKDVLKIYSKFTRKHPCHISALVFSFKFAAYFQNSVF